MFWAVKVLSFVKPVRAGMDPVNPLLKTLKFTNATNPVRDGIVPVNWLPLA